MGIKGMPVLSFTPSYKVSLTQVNFISIRGPIISTIFEFPSNTSSTVVNIPLLGLLIMFTLSNLIWDIFNIDESVPSI